jgi:hypothetical protein
VDQSQSPDKVVTYIAMVLAQTHKDTVGGWGGGGVTVKGAVLNDILDRLRTLSHTRSDAVSGTVSDTVSDTAAAAAELEAVFQGTAAPFFYYD